jgi:hypothetical protein
MNDSIQAYSSGLIEGYLTWDLIQLQWNNNVEHYCDNETEYCEKLFAFIKTNLNFTQSQVEKYRKTDPYWHQIGLSLEQLTGLEDGYNAMTKGMNPLGPRIDINPKGLILMNLMAEVGELEQVLKRQKLTSSLADGKCSAIVKVLPDGSDLFVAHNTWGSYQMMLRIMKKYNLNYKNIPANSITLSSYPGVIYSIDDYYLLSSGLVVLETSIGNYNPDLWKFVVADKIVFEFIRNTVANRMAHNGKEWTQIFSAHNSGTYNNQFMIVDYNKFEIGTNPSELSSDLLWILEQMPGYTESADVTQVLRLQNYWPSYNIPYFKFIYNISDTTVEYKKFGDFYDYNNTARSLIFRRDQNNIRDLSSLYKLMRYNDFKNDPISRCNCTPPFTAEYAIAARCDLNDPKGLYPFSTLGFRPHGAIDVKLTNYELFSKQEMIANSGPTYQQQPPFQWSTSQLAGLQHEGQPDKWEFPGVHVKWLPSKTNIFYDNN